MHLGRAAVKPSTPERGILIHLLPSESSLRLFVMIHWTYYLVPPSENGLEVSDPGVLAVPRVVQSHSHRRLRSVARQCYHRLWATGPFWCHASLSSAFPCLPASRS